MILKDYLYYQDDWSTIYHGDCRDILPLLEPVDLVLTDPPYGIKRDKGFEGFGGFGTPIARRRFEDDNWDQERPDKALFDLLLVKAQSILLFGGNFFADLLPQGKHWIVWDKKNTMPDFGDCELIWTNLPRNSVKIITCEYNGLIGKESWRAHPTQKPLRLLIELLKRYSGDTILDPFMGSGTTLVAAKNLNRKAIGIEIEERYCKIAVSRLKQEVFDFRKVEAKRGEP
jgi:DNA modification methylase